METITNKKYYLDRIYINNKLQNVCFSEMQYKLFKAVKRVIPPPEGGAAVKTLWPL